MPLISPFGHIIKGQGRHLCSQDKLLNGVIKREKIKKATCKREAHGAEEVCPCNSSAVTSKPCDKINGNFLSSMAGTGPCWHHTGDGPMFVTVPWGSQLGKAGKELVG